MDFFEKSAKDYWKSAQIHFCGQIVGDGWSLRQGASEQEADLKVVLYVHDLVSGFSWACGVDHDFFLKASRRASSSGAKITDGVTRATGVLVSAAARGEALPPIDGYDWEAQLAMALSWYAGTTRTWRYSDELRSGGHFIVLHYREPASESGLLRPLSMPRKEGDAPTRLLPGELFMKSVREVVALDHLNHPEWFLGMEQWSQSKPEEE